MQSLLAIKQVAHGLELFILWLYFLDNAFLTEYANEYANFMYPNRHLAKTRQNHLRSDEQQKPAKWNLTTVCLSLTS